VDNNTAFLVLSADKYFVRLTRTNNFNCELRTCSRSLHRMFQAKLHIQLAIIQQLMHEASFHSFIQSISIVPLQVHYYSEALPTQHGYCVGVSPQSAAGNCEWRTSHGPYMAARAGSYHLCCGTNTNIQIHNTNQIYNARKVTPKCESEAWILSLQVKFQFLESQEELVSF